MDLFDRYLGSIAVLLPRDQREDIIAELRDALDNRRHEKEAETGHPLTKDETTALLRGFGHPLAVAGRYGRQQYLIGPDLYPVYVFVLKLVIAIIAASALVTGVVTGIVTAGVNPGQVNAAIRTAIAIFWNGSFSAVGVITVIFALLQRRNVRLKFLDDWNPRDLPRTPMRRRETWFDHVAAIVVQIIFLLWWVGAIQFGQPFMVMNVGQSLHLNVAPIWQSIYWPVIGLSVGAILIHTLKLIGTVRGRLASGLDLLLQIATMAVAGVALQAPSWVVIYGSGMPAKALASIDLGVNISVHITLVVVIVVAACTAAFDIWRLYRPIDPA